MEILASSLDNFVQLANSHSIAQPYVTFTFPVNVSDVSIVIKDKNNDDGYYKEIIGSSASTTSNQSFNTQGVAIINLMECLKMNSIFFNFVIQNSTTLKCNIDTSISYQITSTGGIIVGGTYSTYQALSPNKMVMMLQGSIDDNTTNLTLEKYNNNPIVSFNVTSPFKYQTRKDPLELRLTAYQMYDSKASMVSVPYSSCIIMPTTLTKFQTVDFNDYLSITYDRKVKFLTNNFNRSYNYDEWIGLSFITNLSINESDLTLKKSYYTSSGVFLETKYGVQHIEKNSIRFDFIDTFELNEVEAFHGKQVGYVMVYAYDSLNEYELTEGVRYDVMPHCKGNNEIFFMNELGGVDSFNFTSTKTVERKIEDQSTYFVNQIKRFSDKYEMEYTKQKRNEVTYTLSTHMVSKETAEWLNELNKSKYVFLFNGLNAPMYTMIIVDKFDITTNTSDNEFELELEYHIADNDNNI